MSRRALLFVSLLAAPKAFAEPPASDAVDVSTVKDKMHVVTDGKGHYVAYGPTGSLDAYTFYGDGKDFYQQRVFSTSSEGDKAFSATFWEPRYQRNGASFALRDKQFTAECGNRKAMLTPVPDADAKTMVAAAAWHKPRWNHRAYLLARDEQARYYYVDRVRDPENSSSFRLYVGPKGNLKLQKMTNVVSDSQGDIFATKSGSLRLIADRSSSMWVASGKKLPLLPVPVEENAAMIYTDLGVYTGEKLGTPCDDL